MRWMRWRTPLSKASSSEAELSPRPLRLAPGTWPLDLAPVARDLMCTKGPLQHPAREPSAAELNSGFVQLLSRFPRRSGWTWHTCLWLTPFRGGCTLPDPTPELLLRASAMAATASWTFSLSLLDPTIQAGCPKIPRAGMGWNNRPLGHTVWGCLAVLFMLPRPPTVIGFFDLAHPESESANLLCCLSLASVP